MEFGLTTYSVGFLAGGLSSLSPCVLPLLPIIIGSSQNEHKMGPLAVAFGLAISFALLGTLFASIGSQIGLSQHDLRDVGAIIMAILGVVLVSKKLQERFAIASSGLGGFGNILLAKISITGLSGQFVLGLLLGLIWSPCVGPTLGAAITLASQGSNLVQIALLMGVFGIGAGLPIVVLGLLSRQAMLLTKVKIQGVGGVGKTILGAFLIILSFSIISGKDKKLEAYLAEHSPQWLTELTTTY